MAAQASGAADAPEATFSRAAPRLALAAEAEAETASTGHFQLQVMMNVASERRIVRAGGDHER